MMTQLGFPAYIDPRTRSELSTHETTIQESLEEAVDRGRDFLYLANQFLTQGGNPNLIFPSFTLGDNTYRNPTFFHVVYICWKCPYENWSQEIDTLFESIIDRLLNDRRIDVRSKFTEDHLCDCEHFIDHQKRKHSYYGTEEGYLLEQMTIAHYAMALGDFEMVDKVLKLAPDLLQSTCCFTKGKGLLGYEILAVSDLTKDASTRSWDDHYYCEDGTYDEYQENIARIENLNDDQTSGELALAATSLKDTGMTYPVIRTVKVTLLHLAARLGNDMACGFLRAKEANPFAIDSDKRRPFDYLEVSLSEGFIQETKTTKQLRKSLEPVVRLSRRYLPGTSCVLHREGYSLIFDTRTKIAHFAYERLTKNSLQKNTDREGCNFRIDQEVPQLNRAKHADYSNSGYDRGHMAAAGDAVSSEKAMEDTFLLTNVCPQLPGLNRKYWKHLEQTIRNQVNYYDLVEVFTGGLFLPQRCSDGKSKIIYEVIGNGNIAVPTHFFKVVYFHNRRTTCEAYILPNTDIPLHTPLSNFQVSLNKVQEFSGILFDDWRS